VTTLTAPVAPAGHAVTDAELIERARRGCERSLSELLTRYRPMVRARSSRYFLQGADRADITQEGMIGLYKAIRDFRPQRGAEFGAFAQRCVHRQIVSAVRSASRAKHAPLNASVPLDVPDDDVPSPQPCAGVEDDPEARAIAATAVEAIGRWCASHLTDVERSVLQAHLDGLSYAAISARTGLSAKAVDNAVQRVRRKLQRHLADLDAAAAA
jgi:RNA polymerase sporulation-specific sigma factor